VDGTWCVGKSTLCASLVGTLKSRSILVAGFPEVARRNVFMEDIAVRNRPVDAVAELHLLCEKMASELEVCRDHDLAIVDSSALNVVAHMREMIFTPDSRSLKSAMEVLAAEHAKSYDLVIYLEDYYEVARTADSWRPTDERLRIAVDRQLRRLYEQSCIEVRAVPRGLGLSEKIDWTLSQMTDVIDCEPD